MTEIPRLALVMPRDGKTAEWVNLLRQAIGDHYDVEIATEVVSGTDIHDPVVRIREKGGGAIRLTLWLE